MFVIREAKRDGRYVASLHIPYIRSPVTAYTRDVTYVAKFETRDAAQLIADFLVLATPDAFEVVPA